MKIKHLFLTAVAAITLAACGNQSSQQSSEASKATEAPAQTVKVAVVGSAAHEIWDYVAEKKRKRKHQYRSCRNERLRITKYSS